MVKIKKYQREALLMIYTDWDKLGEVADDSMFGMLVALNTLGYTIIHSREGFVLVSNKGKVQ